MTKTIITLFLALYSAARLSAIVYYLYGGIEGLPTGVLLITFACCLVCLGTAAAHYRGRLRGRTLKSVLMLVASAAAANMLIVYLNPVNDLGYTELLITGTLFDIVLYLGVLTLRLPDGPPRRYYQLRSREDPRSSADRPRDERESPEVPAAPVEEHQKRPL